MKTPIGKRAWAIAEGCIPSWSNRPELQFTSHKTACILNTADVDAHIELTVFFTGRDPVGPYQISVPARRTHDMAFNHLKDPEPIPKDTEYASVRISDVPIIVQHTRLDFRQSENGLLTTIAYAE